VVQANYSATGSTATQLKFNYTIQANQTDANGIAIAANSLSLNSGTILDLAGNATTLTHSAVSDNAVYKVDTTAARVSSVAITGATGIANNTLNAGDVVTVTVTLSEAVAVTGTPQLGLTVGSTVVQASYIATGSTATQLKFNYTILPNQTDANGIAIAANSLRLNGGTILDLAGNTTTLTHLAVSDNAGYIVDTTEPNVVSPITVVNNTNYTARSGQVDTYIIDAAQSMHASISGFQSGDILRIINRTPLQGVNFNNSPFNDSSATLLVGNASIDLVGLLSDLFNNELTFENVYGASSILYNYAPTGTVVVSGTPTQGEVLTASNTLSDLDGLGVVSYQWFADGVAVVSAITNQFVLSEAQVGKAISVVASYTDNYGAAESVTSAATSSVVNANDAPTGSVNISGVATQGQILSASNTLVDADGLGPISYQWQSNNVNIGGAITNTFTLTEAQVGKAISVVASYLDGHGTQESVPSAATGLVAAVPTPPTVTPITVMNNGSYTAIAGQVDTFVVDANQNIHATISGFANGDILKIINRTSSQGINFDNSPFNDGAATLIAGNAFVDLVSLSTDLFDSSEASFENLYGAHAITYAVI
jgi:hypothetical protein